MSACATLAPMGRRFHFSRWAEGPFGTGLVAVIFHGLLTLTVSQILEVRLLLV
jgi:hypothetical protein